MHESSRLKRVSIQLLLVLALLGGPVFGAELVCNIIGTQDAEWRGSEYRLSQSKKYREFNPLWFVTGDAPRVAHPDPENGAWIWDDLSLLRSAEGRLYSGTLQRGGVLSAALNEAETLILLNYLGTSSQDGVTVMKSTNVVAECVAFRRPPAR